MKEMENKRDILYLEIIRIVALFMIMWNHSYEVGFLLFYTNESWLYSGCSILCKAGAPLFFMISGCLLLGKEESFAELLKKRILRTIILIVLYNVIYMIYFSNPISELGKNLFLGDICEVGWFLYSYLTFLLLLPILRKMVKVLMKKDYFVIWTMSVILVTCLPIFEFFVGYKHNAAFNLPELFCWNLFYPLMGYFCGNILKVESVKKWAIGSFLLLVLSLYVNSKIMSIQIHLTGVCVDGIFLKNFLPIIAICIFLFVRATFSSVQFPKICATFLKNLGACGCGVFIIEHILRDKTTFFFAKCLEVGMYQIYASFIWILFAMFVGYAIIFLIRLVPIFRKVL